MSTTYKLGNKITCIVSSDFLYETKQYPVTILPDVSASLTFNDYTTALNARHAVLDYHESTIEEVTLFDVPITNKIISMAFKNKEDLKAVSVVHTSVCEVNASKTLLLTVPQDIKNLFNIYVYEKESTDLIYVEEYHKNYDVSKNPIILPNAIVGKEYLVVYHTMTQDFYPLTSTTDGYWTLDLILTGNQDDNTQDSIIHIDKCSLNPINTLRFNNVINTVDLTFTVINDKYNADFKGRNYIKLGA